VREGEVSVRLDGPATTAVRETGDQPRMKTPLASGAGKTWLELTQIAEGGGWRQPPQDECLLFRLSAFSRSLLLPSQIHLTSKNLSHAIVIRGSSCRVCERMQQSKGGMGGTYRSPKSPRPGVMYELSSRPSSTQAVICRGAKQQVRWGYGRQY
jgi:hypothetical protein